LNWLLLVSWAVLNPQMIKALLEITPLPLKGVESLPKSIPENLPESLVVTEFQVLDSTIFSEAELDAITDQ